MHPDDLLDAGVFLDPLDAGQPTMPPPPPAVGRVGALLQVQTEVHAAVAGSLSELEAILEGIELAAEQVQDIRIDELGAVPKVTVVGLLMETLLTALTLNAAGLVTKGVTTALIRSLAPLRAAMASEAGTVAVRAAVQRNTKGRVRPRQRDRIRKAKEQELLDAFDKKVKEFVTQAQATVLSAVQQRNAGTPRAAGDTPGVAFRAALREYVADVRLAVSATLRAFDTLVIAAIHDGGNDDAVQDLRALAQPIIDRAAALSAVGLRDDAAEPLSPAEIRLEVRLHAEAIIWAILLRARYSVARTVEGYGPVQEEVVRIEDRISARLMQYLLIRLVNPRTGGSFATSQDVVLHLERIVATLGSASGTEAALVLMRDLVADDDDEAKHAGDNPAVPFDILDAGVVLPGGVLD